MAEASRPHIDPDALSPEARAVWEWLDPEGYPALSRLVEQLEAAQERLTAYETPGWINSVQKVMEYRQALRETWDDYAIAIDEHVSEEVRKEARHSMLQRFSAYEEQGWLSNPASEPRCVRCSEPEHAHPWLGDYASRGCLTFVSPTPTSNQERKP